MLFIFDWDGTLSDSTDKIASCMQAAAEDSGLDVLHSDEIKNIIGLAMPEALQLLYPGISPSQQETMRLAYSRHYSDADRVPSAFFPGVLKTLEQLAGEDFRLAVATGKSRRGLDRILDALELNEFFHHSRCADESASKPHPLMLEQLLDEAGVTVADAVMVGDTEWDMRMADNCGMKKIAVSFGAHSVERLKACKPDMLVDDFEQILDWQFN
ncbi:HAD-IA family hydrolase [Agaribacterium haliotis]|uniref:HAD-IA family hydrolase n=1 Tax=Agaribacterium haliotis TaxID=2013869 RepID=UPI000BB58C8B|nr:HAD-IA family hydrolase [Agaribacterium haliotis]